MKQTFFACVFAFLTTAVLAQSHEKDEMAIRRIIQQQQTAWNKHDWEALSSYFTEDGTLINFVGEIWKSKQEILSHFKLLGPCCLEPTSLRFDVKQVRFLSSTLVIVYTEETLFADKDYSVPFRQYKKGDTDYKWRVDVFEKRNDDWKIVSMQMTLINQLISPHKSSDK
jgi:uncharacterized protein (TIGR02246 family)